MKLVSEIRRRLVVATAESQYGQSELYSLGCTGCTLPRAEKKWGSKFTGEVVSASPPRQSVHPQTEQKSIFEEIWEICTVEVVNSNSNGQERDRIALERSNREKERAL